MPEWIKNSLWKIWEGILKHLGVLIVAFVLSGGYLIAINKLKEFQEWVRSIPTDYVLTPLVLLLVLLGVLVRINYKQHQQLSRLETQPPSDPSDNENARFVTHYGVWWKIYPDYEYIEDFPYCPCCDSKQKLVQIEWHPDEVYRCPKTSTEVKLYDNIPWKKEKVLENLYRSYLGGEWLKEDLSREFNRIGQLHPDMDEKAIVREVFKHEPFNRIPKDKIDEIFSRFSSYKEIFHFLRENYRSYKKYFIGHAGKT